MSNIVGHICRRKKADFFFVPVYAACVMTKEKKLADETGQMKLWYGVRHRVVKKGYKQAFQGCLVMILAIHES